VTRAAPSDLYELCTVCRPPVRHQALRSEIPRTRRLCRLPAVVSQCSSEDRTVRLWDLTDRARPAAQMTAVTTYAHVLPLGERSQSRTAFAQIPTRRLRY